MSFRVAAQAYPKAHLVMFILVLSAYIFAHPLHLAPTLPAILAAAPRLRESRRRTGQSTRVLSPNANPDDLLAEMEGGFVADPVRDGQHPTDISHLAVAVLGRGYRGHLRRWINSTDDEAAWEKLQEAIRSICGDSEALFYDLMEDVMGPTYMPRPMSQADIDGVEEVIRAQQADAVAPPPIPSYEEVLSSLPNDWNEQAILEGELGDSIPVILDTLADCGVPLSHRLVISSHLGDRRRIYAIFTSRPANTGQRLRDQFRFLGLKDEFGPLSVIIPMDTDVIRKRPRKAAFSLPSLQPTALSAKVMAKMTAMEIENRLYTDLVRNVIRDAIPLFKELELSVFPEAKADASLEDIARVYGSCITSKLKRGKLRRKGCFQNWRRLYGILHAALESEELSPQFLCTYSDCSGLSGNYIAWTLQWAGFAFGCDTLTTLGHSRTVMEHCPGNILGRAMAPKPPPKKAPWLSDWFVMFLAFKCHDRHPLVRARAAFFYFMFVGGTRSSDAMNVNTMSFVGLSVCLTALYNKTSTNPYQEVTSLPLLDYMGRSLRPAFEALSSQMGSYFLLADCTATRESRLQTPLVKLDGGFTRPCSYAHLRDMLRFLVEDFNSEWAGKPDRFGVIIPVANTEATVHSPKAWLDTLAIQMRVEVTEKDVLCHWNAKTMSKFYNQNFSGVELLSRMKVVRSLQSDWRSAGRGYIPREPYNWHQLPPVPGEQTLIELYEKESQKTGPYQF